MAIAQLVPEAFFQARAAVMLWLFVAVGVGLLVFGADRAVTAAARLAAALGMSKVLIGATVVSLGTTSPEAAVSVNAAFQGNGGLALGNGVGSIICDTALIFGLSCCLTRLPKDRFVLNRHGWLQLGAGVLLTGTALVLWALAGSIDRVRIPRTVGIAYLVLLAGYLLISVRWARQRPELVPEEAAAVKPAHDGGRAVRNLLVLLVGLALIVGGSELLVGSVKEICYRYHVPEAVIAATLVAFGTSLPELATAIASIVKKHPELLVGNVIGADILNGASAAAVPLRVEPIFFYCLLPVMMIVLVLLRTYILARGATFRRWQGLPLLMIYVGYVVLLVTCAPHLAGH